MLPKLLSIALFLVGLITTSVWAVSSLDIQRDTSLNPLASFGSVCDFEDSPDDATLLAMIQAAYKDMVPMIGTNKRPSVMAGLSIGNEVIFSSSIRGSGGIVYEVATYYGGTGETILPQQWQELIQALNTCYAKYGKQHGYNGACGEISSAIYWLAKHPDGVLKDQIVRVAAYSSEGWKEPCSGRNSGTFGCIHWASELGFTVVPSPTQALPTTFPSPTSSSHISLRQCLQGAYNTDTLQDTLT